MVSPPQTPVLPQTGLPGWREDSAHLAPPAASCSGFNCSVKVGVRASKNTRINTWREGASASAGGLPCQRAELRLCRCCRTCGSRSDASSRDGRAIATVRRAARLCLLAPRARPSPPRTPLPVRYGWMRVRSRRQRRLTSLSSVLHRRERWTVARVT